MDAGGQPIHSAPPTGDRSLWRRLDNKFDLEARTHGEEIMRRRLVLGGLIACLVVVLAVPAWATIDTRCQSGNNICGRLSYYTQSGSLITGKAKTYTYNGNTGTLRVITNYETHHFFGWVTDGSNDSGNISGVSSTGYYPESFNCNGSEYNYYSSHWRGSTNYFTITGDTPFTPSGC
jgi:hypothetical protein